MKRTVLHGTCLLNGKHPPGSQLARECPVLNAAARSASRKQGWLTRRAVTPPPDQEQGSTALGDGQDG